MELETVFRVLQIALGIGLVIFVHELGHFLAARLCGVRVEVFSIGMGPRLLAWVRGSTRYQLALMPIGGYVRMAGEERRADGLPPRPDDLSAKSVGARFFIYSGGVLMNLVFGLVVFPIIFYVGVPLPRPVLGDPLPGGPAWEANLPGGTEVLEVNGQEVFDFVHIQTAVALGDPAGSELYVREPGAEPRRAFVEPRYDEGDGLWTIDVAFDFERAPAGGFLLDVEEGSQMWNAGARPGDVYLGVEGALPGLSPLDQWALAANGGPVAVRVAGPGGERTLTIAPIEGPLQRARAGILPPRNRVAGKRDRALELALARGDRLLEVGGRAILRHGDLHAALCDATAGDQAAQVPFRAERDGVPFTGSFALASRADALALADDLALDMDVETTRILVNPGEPAALAGVRDQDDVRSVNGIEVAGWEDTSRLIREASEREEPVVMILRRSGADGQHVLELAVAPKRIPVPDYGFALKQHVYVFRADGAGDAIRVGALCSWRFTQETYLTVRRLLTRDVDFKNLGGIISIGAISYSFAETGWTKLFFFLCLLSINLAVLNVLPIPVLDGGHLLFLIVEKVKGSPVSERVLVYSQVVGVVLIVSLVVLITYNDIVRWFLSPA